MTTKEEPKKLYKIATETILYELFEIEADSYDDALNRMMPTIYDGTDDYPEEVKRVSWYYDNKDLLSYHHWTLSTCIG